jgi:hypothetical protein
VAVVIEATHAYSNSYYTPNLQTAGQVERTKRSRSDVVLPTLPYSCATALHTRRQCRLLGHEHDENTRTFSKSYRNSEIDSGVG